MGLRLRRNLGPVTALSPGEYTLETASGRAAICCPACGGIDELPRTHRVIHGVVAPIWQCETVSCSYRDFISFEAYEEEVVPA